MASEMVWGCTHMPSRQHTNNSNTLYMSNVEVGSGLRWIFASNMTLWHHLHLYSNPELPNLGQTWPVEWYTCASICPWDSITVAQTLCMSNVDVGSGLWWISASNMTLWHHSHSTLELPNLGPTCMVNWFKIPHMPPAGSLKVLHAPARRGGIRRASQTKIYNLETRE